MRFAYRSRPKPGEHLCGDAVGIFGSRERRLFAVSDGLGHGTEAYLASASAMDYLSAHCEEGLETLLWGCHEHVRGTRGLALFLARFTLAGAPRFEYSGVGNVECRTVSAGQISPFCRDGIVGHTLRKVSAHSYECSPGDTFAVFTDGIHSRFDLQEALACDMEQAAETILARWGKDYDDATVLLVTV